MVFPHVPTVLFGTFIEVLFTHKVVTIKENADLISPFDGRLF